ncbi:PilZ domain-containing protein [Qipengyuania sphaerica]|uniref:PilZ domain-containing protein n=1 Tax=Qipengyuania sphaerica TaxID=2867243 RepID=UPI001C875CD4|nr:PilZ domain-containing protein [Qipengyuania sphaerica]MBX7539631.1 PilZ domain-containing protein [Qipengyuania sphaerica]
MQTRETNRQGSNIVLNCRTPVARAQAILCDISHTGCRIELFDGHVSKGQTIFFEIDERNELAGQIMWVRGNEAGVKFMHKLSAVIRNTLEL